MLSGIKSTIANFLTLSNIIKIVVALAILAGVAFWSYKHFISPKLDPSYVPNKEFLPSDGSDSPAFLYFFYTTWCPHCKSARGPWNELKEYVAEKGGKINGVQVNFVEVDCDKDSAKADEYNVTGYPTIKLDHGAQQFDYDAAPSLDSLQEFLNQSLK